MSGPCSTGPARGIGQAYSEPFGIGAGPPDADPEVAYGVAFATAAAEAFQQPFIFERIAFLDGFPGSEAKSRGVEWGRAVGRRVLETRNPPEPSDRCQRRSKIGPKGGVKLVHFL